MDKHKMEMHRAKFRVATGYVTYPTQQLNAIDVLTSLQLNIKVAGLIPETFPSKIKVTIEWKDEKEGMMNEQ